MVKKIYKGCNKSFDNNDRLLKHMKTSINNECKKNIVICGSCHKSFANKSHLDNHRIQSYFSKNRTCFLVKDRINATTILNQKSMEKYQHPGVSSYASEQITSSNAFCFNQNNKKQKSSSSSRTIGKFTCYVSNVISFTILTIFLF